MIAYANTSQVLQPMILSAMTAAGVTFLEAPRHEAYGVVVVFQDPFGNKWDLMEQFRRDLPD